MIGGVRLFIITLRFSLKDKKKADSLQKRARAVLSSPMAFDKEFPQKDVKDMSWVAALSKPFTMALNHFKAVVNGEFNQDIKGLLASPPPGGVQSQHVKELKNLRKQFWSQFDAVLKDKDPDLSLVKNEPNLWALWQF